jgi:Terminase RNaseH-like domain
MARSSSQDAKYLRGHGADRIIADEAAYIPAVVLTQTVPPMLSASPYRELVLISTPFGTGTYFHHRFLDGQGEDPSIASFHFPSSSNPRLSVDYLEQQRREMTELAYRTEYEALFLDEQTSVFTYDLIQAAIDEEIQAGAITGHRYVIGYDPAKYSDRAGLVVLDVTEKPCRAVEVLDVGGRGYLKQATMVMKLAQTYNKARVLLDSTTHDQMLEQLKHQGVSVEGYRFTNESKGELIDGLVLAFERGDLAIPNHHDLIKELTYYRFETTSAGNVKLGAPTGPGHYDDLVTALALAVKRAGLTKKPTPPVAPVLIPRQSPWRDMGHGGGY